MALRAEYTLHQSDLGEFLSAPLWEEKNGTSLSVLSALARLDIDPWAEAARLAALPREAAVSAFAIILRRLPVQDTGALDPQTVANRVVTLLPAGGSTAPVGGNTKRPLRGEGSSLVRWIVLALAALAFVLVLKGLGI
jgi:hypothetical protein